MRKRSGKNINAGFALQNVMAALSRAKKAASASAVPALLGAFYTVFIGFMLLGYKTKADNFKNMVFCAMPATGGAREYAWERREKGFLGTLSKNDFDPISFLAREVFLISDLESEMRILQNRPLAPESGDDAEKPWPEGPKDGQSEDSGMSDAPSLDMENEIFPIEEITISPASASSGYLNLGGIYLNNRTEISLNSSDLEKLLNQKGHFKFNAHNTIVLIIHTHGTEGYTPQGVSEYDPNDDDHSLSGDETVIAVGEILKETLESAGIKTIHDTTIHDYPSYSKSYANTLETIKKQLVEWPNVKIVIDVHRDSLVTQNGIKYKPVTTIDGQKAAQVMLVVGTNASGLAHKNWKTNLSFALKLQKELASNYKDIARPIDLCENRYNQHMTGGSLILEVGTSGNTFEEAQLSAGCVGQVLADVIKSFK